MEPEQPLSSAKFKSEYGQIPAVRFSWCTAMLLSLTCLLRNGFGAALMFFFIGPQAYAWTEGPSPSRCDHRWRCFVKPEHSSSVKAWMEELLAQTAELLCSKCVMGHLYIRNSPRLKP